MTYIELDAAPWLEPDDFFRDPLSALAASRWHERNLDALWDGICSGDFNGIRPPITSRMAGAVGSPLDRSGFLSEVARLFADARAELGLDHTLELT